MEGRLESSLFDSIKHAVTSPLDAAQQAGNAAAGAAGAAVDAVTDAMTGSSAMRIQDRTTFLRFVSNVTAETFLRHSQSCVTTVDVDETITVESAKGRGAAGGEPWYEENAECLRCLHAARKSGAYHRALERRQWLLDDTDVRPRRDIDQRVADTALLIEGCKFSCKACILKDVSQLSAVKVDTACQMSESDMFRWRNETAARVGAALYTRQDTLSALTKALGGAAADKTVVHVQRTLSNLIDQSVVQVMTTAIASDQAVVVKGQGVEISGVTQQARVTAAAQALVSDERLQNVLSKTQWDAFAKAYKSDTTLDNAGNVLTGVLGSFTHTIGNLIGKVVFAVMLVLGAVCVAVVVLLINHFLRKRRAAAGG
jgi:hypothetical protein